MNRLSEFHLSIGAIQIGLLLSIFLHGVVTMQTYKYYLKFPNDPWPLQCLVIVIFALETVHSALSSHFIYYIIERLNANVLYPLTLVAAVFIFGIINGLIQSYFAYRAWRFTPGWLRAIPILCWIICLFRLILTFWIGSKATSLKVVDAEKRYGGLGAAGLLTGAALDIINSGLLCYCLWSHRRDTLRQTRRVLDRLITTSIQTGMLTSLITCIMSICFLGIGNNLVWQGMHFVITKLYSISLLVSLNLRAQLPSEVHDRTIPSMRVSAQIEFASQSRFPTIASRSGLSMPSLSQP